MEAVDRVGTVATIVIVAWLVITDKLVWHTRLRRAEERGDRWEAATLRAMGSAQASVLAAEVTADILAAMPDPARDEASDR